MDDKKPIGIQVFRPDEAAPAVKAAVKRVRVLLVDDHQVVRTGLATLINEEKDLLACGEADNEKSAFEAVHRLHPDVAVVDWSLRNGDASELVRMLRLEHPRLPVLVLSVHDEVFYAERALRAGASGYVMKREATDKIVEAIRHVADGRTYLSERAVQAIPDGVRKQIEVNWAAGPEEDGSVIVRPSNGVELPPAPGGRETIPSVSIIIPVFNAEATIERLCETLVAKLSLAYRLQVVLVDDGSTDNSAALCRQIHGRHPEVVDFLSLSKNFGEHNAVMAGLHCAEGDYCVIMDDDFQNPPSEVRKLIDEIARGFDVVYAQYEAKRHPPFRNLGSRLHNWMATLALGKPADLYLSSFKALSKFTVQEVLRYTGSSPYLDAIILRATHKIGRVTVRHDARKHGRSGYTVAKLFSLWGNMIVTFSLFPVRVMGFVGLVMAVLGMLIGLKTLLAWFGPSISDPDSYQKLSASLWFWRGVNLLFMAVVAEYAGRIYRQMTRHPQFVIRNVLKRSPKS